MRASPKWNTGSSTPGIWSSSSTDFISTSSSVVFHAGHPDAWIRSFLVTNFGNRGFLQETIWSIPAFSITTTAADVLVQSWYCHRVWMLSDRNRWSTFPLIALVAAGAVVSLVSDVKLSVPSSVKSTSRAN
ncbi:hypothetical protein PHLGIDRAFT_122887 [Phlebiopsis gigantea 11061_1 CR5-6]|uniref:Uncharacterized protein n=1 Tax=Phlebiopsis gigantea (strain 11061_1 CR5-6) TaxID=745531 RepID=A0A0C3S2Q3_PHLG1|nr:hypothetical protein PHLGIDRAFT_122887 [Phlebiopsis gigantea 11061_1 CR5-6]